MTDKQMKDDIKKVVKGLMNLEFTIEDELEIYKSALKKEQQENEKIKKWLPLVVRLEKSYKDFVKAKSLNYKVHLDQILTELTVLRAENKDLKEWKKTVVDMFNRTCKCKYLNQEAALCGLSGKQCVAINECMYKKHQALVAIKKYCEDQNLKADFTACEILQIISEVLDEKEMGNNTSNKTTSIQS